MEAHVVGIAVGLGLALVLGLGVGGWVRRMDRGRGPDPGVLALAQEVSALRAVLTPKVVRPEATVLVKLMSGSGRRELGRRTVGRRQRVPTMRVAIEGQWMLFAASHEDGEGWVYRRVGVERA